MQIIQSNILKIFTNLTHAFTTKDGGISKPPYSSLNLAFHVGDDRESVIKNHNTLAKNLAYDRKKLIHMKQVHSNLVIKIDNSYNFDNPPQCDALITNRVNTPLIVMVADCAPILFYDDVKKVIAAAHAGRQGTFLNIIQNIVNSFKNEFNSNTSDIIVSIGASIGSCCYEVGDEISDEAKKLDFEYAMTKRKNSFYLNISKILKTQLRDAGIKEENIEISSECTCCKNNKYFSYRADGVTGRFCGVIELR